MRVGRTSPSSKQYGVIGLMCLFAYLSLCVVLMTTRPAGVEQNNNNNNNKYSNDAEATMTEEEQKLKKQLFKQRRKNPEVLDEYYRLRLERIKKTCGDICEPIQINLPEELKNPRTFHFSDLIPFVVNNAKQRKKPSKTTDSSRCTALFSPSAEELFDSEIWPPPKRIPPSLLDAYSNNGTIKIRYDMYSARKYAGGVETDAKQRWSNETVEELMWQATQEIHGVGLAGTYGKREVYNLKDLLLRHLNKITGKHGLVIGSENPWLEALLLSKDIGAASVTTLEYRPLNCSHPKIKTLLPSELARLFREGFLDEKKKKYDFAASYSSLEHSGMGRYGDHLNPYGDVIVAERVRCVVKENGAFFLGLPNSSIESENEDAVFFNVHRNYGSLMWLRLLNGWMPIDMERNLRHCTMALVRS